MKIKDGVKPDGAGGQIAAALAVNVAKTMQINEGKPSEVGTSVVPYGVFVSQEKSAICFKAWEGRSYFTAFTKEEELILFQQLLSKLRVAAKWQGEPA